MRWSRIPQGPSAMPRSLEEEQESRVSGSRCSHGNKRLRDRVRGLLAKDNRQPLETGMPGEWILPQSLQWQEAA